MAEEPPDEALAVQRLCMAALLLTALAGCSGSPSGSTTPTTSAATPAGVAVTYTCPMHPEILSDKPGKCPKCGMDLVVKK